jgi:hypothetical protein
VLQSHTCSEYGTVPYSECSEYSVYYSHIPAVSTEQYRIVSVASTACAIQSHTCSKYRTVPYSECSKYSVCYSHIPAVSS